MSDFPDLQALIDGAEMTRDEARAFMTAIIDEALPAEQVAAAICVMRSRHETSAEFIGFLDVLFDRMKPLPYDGDTLIDTCGTGGDGLGTFNISTATAIVAAAAGVPVAKHGNRSVSSKSGSSDVLEAAGVPITDNIDKLAGALDKLGIAFLFAPYHHPALKSVAQLRRNLGVRTVFNFLGPQANPAPLTHQYVGVSSPQFFTRYGEVFAERGLDANVVHGRSGADEALPGGAFRLLRVREGAVAEELVEPSAHGVDDFELSDFRGGTPAENAVILLDLLRGEGPKALQQAVALNVGLALELTGRERTIRAGFETGMKVLKSGDAQRLLDAYIAEVG